MATVLVDAFVGDVWCTLRRFKGCLLVLVASHGNHSPRIYLASVTVFPYWQQSSTPEHQSVVTCSNDVDEHSSGGVNGSNLGLDSTDNSLSEVTSSGMLPVS